MARSCIYFFKGSRYVRYDTATDRVDVGPVAISRFWPGLPAPFHADIDAAVNWGNGKVYIFKGERYVRYNIATDMVDFDPLQISVGWRGHLPPQFHGNIDAAVNWGNGKVYFFKGAGYVRYDIAGDRVDVGPVEIARFWTGLPKEFQSSLDAVVNWGNGKVYFFKGARYVRYNIATNHVDVGPVEIARYWKGLPKEFQSNLDAAVNWTSFVDLAGLLRSANLVVNEVGNWRARVAGGGFAPDGIVLHHTAARNSLNVIVNGRPGLAGPLANFHVPKNGDINLVSGGRANHAGQGAQRVLDDVRRDLAPPDTAARRGLADALSGNAFFYGFEMENLGDGVDPWPAVQLEAVARACAALRRRHCWSVNRIISHAEWTRRKIDPRGVDMNAFRAHVATLG